jgi:hypothetical protein
MENFSVVVQIKLSNDWLGTMSELEYRYKIEEDFSKIFEPLDIGYCDGGQIGTGSMEIFIEEVSDIDFALEVILQHLRSLEIKPEYKVAWRKNTPSNSEKFKVAFASNKNRLFSFSFFDFE